MVPLICQRERRQETLGPLLETGPTEAGGCAKVAQILGHGERFEYKSVLRAISNGATPFNEPARRRHDSREDLQKRGLSRTVLADDTDDLAGADRDVDVAEYGSVCP